MGKMYECPNGHKCGAVLQIIVADMPGNLDALPYQGHFCFVCFAAWVAKNVPRVEEVIEFEIRKVQ